MRKKPIESETTKLSDRVEISVPPDFPFGPVHCRKEYADVFVQLFQTPLKIMSN